MIIMKEKILAIRQEIKGIKSNEVIIEEDKELFIKRVIQDIESENKDIKYALYASLSDITRDYYYSFIDIDKLILIKNKLGLISKEVLAIYKLYEEKDGNIDLVQIFEDFETKDLTFQTDLEKKQIVWYFNYNSNISFVCYVDTFEIINENDKIKNLLGKEN